MLLQSLKDNLAITDEADKATDGLLMQALDAAVGYAERFQGVQPGAYASEQMPPQTRQAVIMLASFLYESRTGATAGFQADTASAAKQVWDSANTLLETEKRWDF